MTAWIKMTHDDDADPDLLEALELARTPHGTVDNVMRVHSLRPNTLRAHVALYRAALHDERNTLPAWFQETVASYVSMLNNCPYSLDNHWANACHLIGDRQRAGQIHQALKADVPQTVFEGAELAMLHYTRKLTLDPGRMNKSDTDALKQARINDGEILELNQIIGYFNYANRCLNGLGVTTEGDVVGYYNDTGTEN